MPLNNEYKRYFIILQEDDKGYELAAGKVPTGYVKLEIKNGKGKLTAYAQNVKNGDKVEYHMLLIAPSKKAAVDMGRIMVDGTGRGELNIEYDADNVMKSGMKITDFMVAAVSSNTGIPLSGYTGRDKIKWKNGYNIINKAYDRIDKKKEKLEEVVTPIQTKPIEVEIPIEQPVIIPKKEEIVEEIEEVPIEEPILIETPEIIEAPEVIEVPEVVEAPEVVEIPEVEEVPEQPKKEVVKKTEYMETQTEIKAKLVIEAEPEPVCYEHLHYEPDECKKDYADIDYKNFYYDEDSDSDSDRDSDNDSDSDSDDRDKKKKYEKDYEDDKHSYDENPMNRRLMKVLQRLRRYEPFPDGDSREDWFKVEDDIFLLNNVTIPFMGSMMPLGYPFMMNDCIMMIGRKDYIIGVKYDRRSEDKKYVKHIMFGMPGMYNKQEEKHYSIRGYTSFRPHKSKRYGYWIMTVDLSSGEIVTK